MSIAQLAPAPDHPPRTGPGPRRRAAPASAPFPRAPRPAASCSTSESTRPRPPQPARPRHRIVEALKRLTAEIAPSAETYAAVALAPDGAGGRDVDVVRLALQDPAASPSTASSTRRKPDRAPAGVVVDISPQARLLDGEAAALTYKEFELLQYLVLREGRTIERAELIAHSGSADEDEVPNERTIDVHVRRLRAKLGGYEDIVRTVRGVGYRFDRHADVSIRQASTPSPDLF